MAGQWLWILFGVVVCAALIFDTVVFVRRPHAMTIGQSVAWTLAWAGLAAAFAAAVYGSTARRRGWSS